MECILDKFKTYSIESVQFDAIHKGYYIKVTNPPPTCPEGIFSTRTLEFEVDEYSPAIIKFNHNTNRAFISIPSHKFITQVNDLNKFFFNDVTISFLLIILGISIGTKLFMYLSYWKENPTNSSKDLNERYDETYTTVDIKEYLTEIDDKEHP